MKLLYRGAIWSACFLLWSCTSDRHTVPTDSWHLNSPNGLLAVHVFLDGGKLSYSVDYKEKEVIGKSPLGVIMEDRSYDSSLKYTGGDSVKIMSDQYTLASGKRLSNDARTKELAVHFENGKGQGMDLIFRAYNEGVAFRYAFKGKNGSRARVIKETTGFHLPDSASAWIQPYDTSTMWSPGYEQYYLRTKAGEPSPRNEGWCFPALFHDGTHWIMLTESGLDSTYFGSHLHPQSPGAIYTVRNPEANEAWGNGDVTAQATLPMHTPWRIILLSESLSDLVESNLVHHVASASRIADFSWVKPGRASWSWWSDHESSKDYRKLESFVDLAAEMGWEYSLVDANWNQMKGGTMEQLVAYAQNKNVGLFLWYNSGGSHNKVTEQPRDLMSDGKKRKAEMARIQDLGVKGIKVDFFQSDKQYIIKLYEDILRDAADHHLMVNFHGCTIPRGWARTWPNLVTMESVRGAESYSFAKDFPQNAPAHNVTLAFTRNVVGSMDYTPVTFTDQQYPHLTTYGHELALSVVFESGIVHFADRVSAFRNLPAQAKELLSGLPTAWDDTKYVAGLPEKDVTLARRKGDTWYIAHINGEATPKQLEMDLDFIEPGTYEVIWIGDGPQGKSLVSNNSVQTFPAPFVKACVGYGGWVAQLKRRH